VFGAVSPADGCHDSLVLPWADTGAMSLFLREVAKRHRGECVLMFMDRAGWHRSEKLKVPPNMPGLPAAALPRAEPAGAGLGRAAGEVPRQQAVQKPGRRGGRGGGGPAAHRGVALNDGRAHLEIMDVICI
jgi:hypothetical protein